MSLLPVIEMTNELCDVLTDVEMNGIFIDVDALDDIEQEYLQEKKELENFINDKLVELVGDTPINMGSPAQMSMLVYSKVVNNKETWARVFGLGEGQKCTLKPDAVIRVVDRLTSPFYKTRAEKCERCTGKGHIRKLKKDGTPYKNTNNCPACGGEGVIFTPTGEIAGLQMEPNGLEDINTNGFSTKKDKLEELAENAREQGPKDFLAAMVRLSKISHYLSNFIGGIRRAVKGNGILHPQFMQAVTRTGRLSSRDPNFQNQPRGGTFPVRRVVVSRWKGGTITEADYAQLEFRVAAALSGCKQAFKDIEDGIDVHSNTARKIFGGVTKDTRQAAKADTFKPLYGGQTGTDAQQAYYRWFLDHYAGIKTWHNTLLSDAVRGAYITLPSGRQYAFPGAKRFRHGGVLGGTKIRNYPVQGFATADIVPCAVISVHRRIRRAGLRSVLINTVHDSIVVDTYPGEEEQVALLLKEVMEDVVSDLERRFGYTFPLPLDTEVKQGPNWLDMKEVA